MGRPDFPPGWLPWEWRVLLSPAQVCAQPCVLPQGALGTVFLALSLGSRFCGMG